MTRIAGDSTTYTDIPLTVQVAMTYATGSYAVAEAAVEARFPRAKYGWARIDTTGAGAAVASVRDWETGDKAGSLEQWVIDHNKASGRKDAVVYCNRSTVPEVRVKTGSQVLGQDYFLFVASLDGTVVTGPGIVACQVKGANLTGGHWDESLVFSTALWLPVTPPAPVPPKPPVPSALKGEFEAWLAQGVGLIGKMS
jgi:hypothetical protein